MNQIDKQSIIDALSNVLDPEIKQDLVSLNMVKNVEINENNIAIEIELTTPACPMKSEIRQSVIDAIKEIDNAKDVTVVFSAKPKPKDDKIKLDNIKQIIAVGSGKGGVGKSTVATYLSLSLAEKGNKVGLLDLDAYGPNIPQILNCQVPLNTDGEKIIPLETNNVKVISIGLIIPPDQAVIWRGPMLHKLVEQFIKDVKWGELDYLIIDLPPGTGDIQISLAQMVDVDGAIVVTTPQDLSVTDVRKAITMYRQLQIDIIGLIENMSYFICPHCNEKTNVFSADGGVKLAKELKLELLGQLPILTTFSENELARGVGYFKEIVDNIEKSIDNIRNMK